MNMQKISPITYEMIETSENQGGVMIPWMINHKEEMEKLSQMDRLKISNVIYRKNLSGAELNMKSVKDLLEMYQHEEAEGDKDRMV